MAGSFPAKPSGGDTPWLTAGNAIWDSCQGPVANLYQNSAQTIAVNTSVAITLDSETFDTHNGHDTVTNNTRWTCPSGWDGYYLVAGSVFFASGSTGVRLAWLRVNGSIEVPGSVNRRGPFSGGDGDGMPVAACILSMVAGDYVELFCLHTQSTTINTLASGQYRCGLNIAFLRI